MKTNIKKVIIALSLTTSCLSAQSVDTVEISDVLPSAGQTGEASPNVWLTLDDSGSMATGITYDPSAAYQIPNDSSGNPVKTLAQLQALGNRSYTDPFTGTGTRTCGLCNSSTDNYRIWASFYRTRNLTLKSALAIVFNDSIVENMRIGYQTINNPGITPRDLLPVKPLNNPTNKLNFYNWLFRVRASGGTPLRIPLRNAYNDISTASRNTNSSNNPFLNSPGNTDSNLDYCRRNYNIHLSDGGWNGGNPSVGNIDNTPVTLPDGTSYTPSFPYSDNNTNYVSDITFRMWANDLDDNPTTDSLEPYYPKIFNPDGSGPVVQTLGGSEYWHPYNNPATWQHISTYGITIGMNPTLSINKPDTQLEAINGVGISSGILDNTTPFGANRDPNDIIHSALNGRGQYYNVIDSVGLIDAFNDIIQDIDAISSVARGNGGSVSTPSKGQSNYIVTQYDPSDYSGDVISYPIYNGNADDTAYVNSCFENPADYDLTLSNQVCNKPTWRAQPKLDTKPPASRVILTSNSEYDASGNKITIQNPFTDTDLTPNQYNTLYAEAASFASQGATTPADLEQTTKDLINYVRGERSREVFDSNGVANSDGVFRTRGSVLGDIGRSTVALVGKPGLLVSNHPLFSQQEFLDFYSDNKNREPIVYVGANDGMIHAFRNPYKDASNYNTDKGEELFAYIPEVLIKKLPLLAINEGAHQAYNDGKINTQSVNFNSTNWLTVLVSALGAGGKGIVSLDVTDPVKYIQNNKPIARWEYTEQDSRFYADKIDNAELSNVGNIMGDIGIFELQDGTWAAITGNGYNSERNRAVLLVINLETGKTIQELEVPRGFGSNDGPGGETNGLGPVYLISTNQDGLNLTRPDRGYAGDLRGNLWVFDFSNADASGGITVVNDKPLVQAISEEGKRQAITTYPVLTKHPTNLGYLVHFGTGALFTADDFTSEVTNSIYAVWDDWEPGLNNNSIDRNYDLRKIEFNYQTDTDTKSGEIANIRTIPVGAPQTVWANIANASTNSQTIDGNGPARGWFIDLTDPNNPYKTPNTERVWQPAYYTFGESDIEAISYISTKFSGGLAATCDSNEVMSWEMVFDPSDGSQILKESTLDTDSDGIVNSGDTIKTPETGDFIATSGLEHSGLILAPTALETVIPPDQDPLTGTDKCNSATTIMSSADSEALVTAKTCKPIYPSSWLEIKRPYPQPLCSIIAGC